MPLKFVARPEDAVSFDDLREQIRTLSYDDAFGMLTRPALVSHARKLPQGSYFVLFLDLDGLHDLNHRVGYEEVNDRVRRSFVPALRHTDLVGRWYSGDEILFVLPHDERTLSGLVARLTREAAANQLSFTYAFSRWEHPCQDLAETVSMLSRLVLSRKEAKKPLRA